jgi:hypothetical protein
MQNRDVILSYRLGFRSWPLGGDSFVLTASNRRSNELRTTASALRLSCYIVDDVTRANMAYIEHSLTILSHIVLAKFAITSREIF